MMPLDKDPNKGGTNADGSISEKYCSMCYRKGAFTNPEMTAKQMQDFVKGKLREMGYGKFKSWLFVLGIPKLERWRGT